MPESEAYRRWILWIKTKQIITTKDADHARRMAERRNVGQERWLHGLACAEAVDRTLRVDKELDRLDAGRERRPDQVFALTNEETQAVALTARREPADEA